MYWAGVWQTKNTYIDFDFLSIHKYDGLQEFFEKNF